MMADQTATEPKAKPKKKPWGYWKRRGGNPRRPGRPVRKGPKTIAIPIRCCPNCGFKLPVSMNVEV